MASKVRNVRLGVFSGGGCHHPNVQARAVLAKCSTSFDLDLDLANLVARRRLACPPAVVG